MPFFNNFVQDIAAIIIIAIAGVSLYLYFKNKEKLNESAKNIQKTYENVQKITQDIECTSCEICTSTVPFIQSIAKDLSACKNAPQSCTSVCQS